MAKKKFQIGFTLIELMITVLIIGILATIAIPSYQTYVKRIKLVDLYTTAHIGQSLVEEYIQSTNSTNCLDLRINGQLVGDSAAGLSFPFNSNNVLMTNIDNGCMVTVVGKPTVFATSLDNEYSTIPNVQLVANTGRGKSAPPPYLFAVPTITNGSISWQFYSNGNAVFSGSLPGLPF